MIKFSIITILFSLSQIAFTQTGNKAVLIADIPWTEARSVLTDTTIVVIPLGAEAKEHGPHLLLKNDWLIAEYLKNKVAKDEHVVIYPTINYHYYPAFLEYPGSTSLRFETSVSAITDIISVIAGHGPKKFYILNTGVSTLAPLKIASERLANKGIIMKYTDILNVAGEAEKKIKQQTAGTHADEIETSMMLVIAPKTVDMSKAARDIPEKVTPGPLTLDPSKPGRYSPTGIFGDATLATKEKGQVVLEAMVTGIRREIEALRKVPLLTQNSFSNIFIEGLYLLNSNAELTLRTEGKSHFLDFNNQTYPLTRQDENHFQAGTVANLTFFPDTRGTIDQVYLSILGKDYLGQRKK